MRYWWPLASWCGPLSSPRALSLSRTMADFKYVCSCCRNGAESLFNVSGRLAFNSIISPPSTGSVYKAMQSSHWGHDVTDLPFDWLCPQITCTDSPDFLVLTQMMQNALSLISSSGWNTPCCRMSMGCIGQSQTKLWPHFKLGYCVCSLSANCSAVLWWESWHVHWNATFASRSLIKLTNVVSSCSLLATFSTASCPYRMLVPSRHSLTSWPRRLSKRRSCDPAMILSVQGSHWWQV